MNRKVVLLGLLVLSLAIFASPARADLVIDFNTVFSSGPNPDGTGPWLTATFHNLSQNTVQLTLTSHLVAPDYLSDVYFNIDPGLGNPSPSMVIGQDSGVTYSLIHYGTDCCKADGDGYYDLEIDFPTAAASRFGAGSSAVFTLTFAGLTEDSFNFLSTAGGGEGTYTAAAHIQSIGTNGASTWLAGTPGSPRPPDVPEPSSLMLLGTGLAGLSATLRRKLHP